MKKIIALSCFAAVMLVGCGKSRQESSGTSKATEAATTAVQTTEAATTAAVTTTAETTTEADTTTAAGDRTTMYKKVYEDKIKKLYDELFEYENGKVKISYTTYDIDADGVPDLVLKYDTHFMVESEEDMLEMYTVDENCELLEIGSLGPSPAAWGCAGDTGRFSLIFEMDGYIGIHNWVLVDGRVKINDSVEYDRDENTVTKEVITENGFKYLPYVTIIGSDEGIKSTVTDPNTGSSEEKDGMFLDFAG